MKSHKKIVCLGGGIGSVNLIKGLKEYTKDITVVVSLADEGGSSGRLRKLYKMPPPGDLISCMSALLDDSHEHIAKLLTYRFPGDRYGSLDSLGGHKVGNLIMASLFKTNGDFMKCIWEFQKLFNISGTYLPATTKNVTISAETVEGRIIVGEETIDLGKYSGKRVLHKVMLHPKNADSPKEVIQAILNADYIIAGPGDLYTTLLPVLIVPGISKALQETKAKKAFIVNVANKPFETKGYTLEDYITAINKHLGSFPFSIVFLNNNFEKEIPKKYRYSYVKTNQNTLKNIQLIQGDYVNSSFPLYHDPHKLAKAVLQTI